MPNNMTPYGQMPGGVATGHVPQQPNLGLGPNRYVPPTFNWGQRVGDNAPNYQQMDWNQMQGFYMPQQQNNTFTNPYMQQLQGMLGMFSNQYGGPNRQPTLPQFGSYNPGFGGPTSFYDQSLQDWGRSAMGMQRNMGQDRRGGYVSDQSQWFNADGSQYDPTAMRMAMGITGDDYNPIYDRQGNRINVPGGGRQGPGADYFRNLFEGGGGGMYGREYDRRAAYEHARQQPDFDWGNYGESMDGPRMPYGGNGGGFGGGGGLPPGYSYDAPGDRGYTMEMPTNGGRWAYGPNGERIVVGGSSSGPGADYFRNLFEGGGGGMQNPEGLVGNYGMSGDQIGGNSVNPIYANRGGFGGRGGYPMMPQFNPYMLARNNMRGMDFNEMFDPRFAMLFGMGGLGAMRPQGFAATQPQQPPSTANGQKPLAIGGGG